MYTYIGKEKMGELVALQKGGFPGKTRVILETNQPSVGDLNMLQFGKALDQVQPGAIALDLSALHRPNPDRYLQSLPAEKRRKLSLVARVDSPHSLVIAAKDYSASTGLVVVRIKMARGNTTSVNEVIAWAASFKIPLESIAILLDFETLPYSTILQTAEILAVHAEPFAGLGVFESVSVCGTSFPSGISALSRGWNILERPEIDGWLHARKLCGYELGFADYGPRSHQFPPTGIATSLAQVRYTCPDKYLVYKGKPIKGGADEHFQMGRDLMEKAEFRGPHFSWGDSEINNIARQTRGPGNRTTWISIETSHHLTLTAGQVALLS